MSYYSRNVVWSDSFESAAHKYILSTNETFYCQSKKMLEIDTLLKSVGFRYNEPLMIVSP